MISKIDPIIAVRDIPASSIWYQKLLGCHSMHGGNEFDILVSQGGEILMCLHRWGTDSHPTMIDQNTKAGNGLILYFRTPDLEKIRENAHLIGAKIEEEIHVNPNSTKKEFSVRDPDGYYLTITEYHEYEG